MKSIFIGGTGSSGTTILRKIISRHSKLYAFPFETRFLIDPDGIVDLYNGLLYGWAPYMIDKKIKRFRNLIWSLSGGRK